VLAGLGVDKKTTQETVGAALAAMTAARTEKDS